MKKGRRRRSVILSAAALLLLPVLALMVLTGLLHREGERALTALDAFDNQLAAKINNGQITNPYAADLLAASAQVRAILNAMSAAL